MEEQPNRVREQAKSKQNVTLRQIQIDHVIYCLILPTNNVMVSLKDEFTIWRQGQKEDFLSIIYLSLAQHDAWSTLKSKFLW